MNEKIKAKDNLKELMTLMCENPELSVIPMVDCDVVAGDDFRNWAASFGSCRVDKILNGYDTNCKRNRLEGFSLDDQRIYFYSDDDEDITDKIIDFIGDDAKLFNDKYFEELLDSLPWQDAIVVNINLPE